MLGEAVVLLVIGAALALAANHFSPRGLKLKRDYFPKSAAPAALATAAKNTTSSVTTNRAAGVPAAIVERLRLKGLQALGHSAAAGFFHDPQYGRGIIFVDARDDEHYLAGHIPGAYQLYNYQKENYLLAAVPPCLTASTVVVYCNGGECEDSEFTAITLNEAGVALERLFVYAGGLPMWKTNGLPVETGARASGNLLPAKP